MTSFAINVWKNHAYYPVVKMRLSLMGRAFYKKWSNLSYQEKNHLTGVSNRWP
jgi:hypothetical protein